MSYLDDPDHVWELEPGSEHQGRGQVLEDLMDRVLGASKNVGGSGPNLSGRLFALGEYGKFPDIVRQVDLSAEGCLFRIMLGAVKLSEKLQEQGKVHTLESCLDTAMVWEFG